MAEVLRQPVGGAFRFVVATVRTYRDTGGPVTRVAQTARNRCIDVGDVATTSPGR
jgi:hypothetical protein